MQYLDNGMIIVDDRWELRSIIMKKEVPLELIDIKASGLTHLMYVFVGITTINGDISNWDVSNITRMNCTFLDSTIQPNLSNWNVSNVVDFASCFEKSQFNGNISNWNVSNATNLNLMFSESKFNGDLSKWNVSKVEFMRSLFFHSSFNNNSLNNWDISNVNDFTYTFAYCDFNGNISNWNFNEKANCDRIIFKNDSFKNKYELLNNFDFIDDSRCFLKWFKENKLNISNANLSKEEILEIDDYLNTFEFKKPSNNL